MPTLRPLTRLALGLALLTSAPLAYAKEYPIQLQVVTFGGPSYLEATQVSLDPNAEGRYAAYEGAYPLLRAGSCKDFLTEFQTRPLEVMRRNGYISSSVYEELSKDLLQKLDPRQLVLVNLFSDMPRDEAIQLFGGEIPESRLLMRRQSKDGRDLVRIGRGSIFAVRGQIPVTDSKGAQVIQQLPVPWELGALPTGLARKFDRSRIAALVEIGRAHSEHGILPGDLRLAVRTLAVTLEKDFHFLKIPANQVVVTGHFLDPQHGRLFTTRFPMRPLTPELQAEIETAPEATLARIPSLPVPSAEEWQTRPDTVVVTSLENSFADFKVAQFSEAAYQISKRSGGKVTGLDALHLVAEFFDILREDFTYEMPGYGRSPAPIMLRDRGTAMPSLPMLTAFKRRGLIWGNPDFIAVRDYIQVLAFNPEPDLFLSPWKDDCFYIRGEHPDCMRHDSVVEVANLDPDAAAARPMEYLASVLLSITDLFRHRIESMSPDIYALVLQFTNEMRAKKGLPAARSLDATTFLESHGLSLASGNSEVIRQLRILGGKPIAAVAIGLKLENGRDVHMGINPSHVYEFGLSEIREIEKRFPGLVTGARKRLHLGANATRRRWLTSAYQ